MLKQTEFNKNNEETTQVLMLIVYNSNKEIIRMLPYKHAAGLKAFELSEREQEVLDLLIEGHSYKMVAGQLFIAMDTVRSHIKNIYKKLKVNSKSEAVAKALRHNSFTL